MEPALKLIENKSAPTTELYSTFQNAYDYFNAALFAGTLPHCLITVQRHRKAYGYFSFERFEKGEEKTDEIAMNIEHFSRPNEEIMSTLVHEMVHLWQAHYGKTGRNGYHNKEWAKKMLEIGLVPSDTGAEGGKQTGQKVSHYVAKDGAFSKQFALWEKQYNIGALFFDKHRAAKKESKGNKIKYVCAGCDKVVWGKGGLNINCGDCDTRMSAEEGE